MKQDITKSILNRNLLKNDTVLSDFEDYCYSNLQNENTSAIEMKEHFTAAATKRCSSSCV